MVRVSARKRYRTCSSLILLLNETGWALGWQPPLISFSRTKASIDVQTDLDQGSNFILKFETASLDLMFQHYFSL